MRWQFVDLTAGLIYSLAALCKARRQFGFWRNQFCVLPPQLKQVFWETVQEVGGAPALVMDGWQCLRSFCLRPARRGAVMEERAELLMITAVRTYIAASAALAHTPTLVQIIFSEL